MFYNRRFALHTLGCKLNFSETSAIGRTLTDAGYQKVDFSEAADYYIINTCSVTQNADKETRQIVRSARRTNPDARVVIIGCYAQLKPEEIAGMPGVNIGDYGKTPDGNERTSENFYELIKQLDFCLLYTSRCV